MNQIDCQTHQDENIFGFCLHSNCQMPAVCFQCIDDENSNHRNHQWQRILQVQKTIKNIHNLLEEWKAQLSNSQCYLKLSYEKIINFISKNNYDLSHIFEMLQNKQYKDVEGRIEELRKLPIFEKKLEQFSKNQNIELGQYFEGVQETSQNLQKFFEKILDLLKNDNFQVESIVSQSIDNNSNYGNQINHYQDESIVINPVFVSRQMEPPQEQSPQDDYLMNLQIQELRNAEVSEKLNFANIEQESNPAKCLQILDEVLAIDENNEQAYWLKYKTLTTLNNQDEALQCIKKCVEINPKFIEGWKKYMQTLFKLQKYNEALDIANQAIQHHPQNSRFYSDKGAILLEQKKYQQSIECCNKAIQLDPRNGHAYNNKACSLQNQNKFKEALDNQNEAISCDISSIDFFSNKYEMLMMQKMYEQAKTFIMNAPDLIKKHGKYFLFLAEQLSREGKQQEALNAINQGLQLDKNVKQLYQQKYQLLLELGKIQEGIEFKQRNQIYFKEA